MKEIPLTKGYVALVDDQDYDRVAQFKWNAFVDTRTVYARRTEKRLGNKTEILMHRFILGCREFVDHEDTNGLNNQRCNLRPATHSQNGGNRRKQLRATSRFKGVWWDKKIRKWRTAIKINYVRRHLANCRDEVDAATIYNFAAEEAFGEFARLNTPLPELPATPTAAGHRRSE